MKSSQKDGKKKKIVSIVVGIIALFVIISIVAGGGKNNTNNTSGTTTTASTTKTTSSTASSIPGINQPANDGSFQFTVTSLQCNQSQVLAPDGSGDASTAGAPYCIMGLTIKNIKTTAQSFDDDSQYIYSASGTQYSVDDDATETLEPDSSTFAAYPTVNPGVSISGQLVFDVPSNVTPAYAMLHDSSFSNGVKVDLQ
jgi:hypothetical protein